VSLKIRQFYRFGEFCLDATAKVLLRGGHAVHLTPKAIETLLVLASHPDQVLTKDELIEAIWKDKVVDEANLMQNIAVARKALGVKPSEPGFIETFPGRGYRMVGPIVADEELVHGPKRHSPQPDAAFAMVSAAPQAAAPRRLDAWWKWAALVVTIGGLVAVAGLLAGRRHPAQSLTRTPVERLDGKEYQSAISPDGKDVAFIVDKGDGRPSYMVIKLAGRSQPVTKAASDRAYSSPAWSPDGKLLAFLRFGRHSGELALADRDGSGERVVTHVFKTRRGLFYRHLAWSPDGQWLAVDDAGDPSDPFSIFRISVSTGARRQLTTPQAHYIGDVEPRFSPDGRRLSFIRVIHRSVQALMVAQADGSSVRQVTANGMQVAGQDWTSDGQSLVFSGNQIGEFRLWRVAAGKTGAAPVLDPAGIYADAPIQIAIARAAPVLLYSVLRQDFNIWRFDLGARAEAAGRWTEIINSSAQDASPQYSPDGREICFRSDRTGDEQIWVSTADGSNPQQVTSGRLSPSVGRWSPDGRSIVFNNSQDRQVYVSTRDDGGKWSVRPLGVEGTHPVFSTDGGWIYMGRNDAAVESIFKVPAAGGPAETISRGHGLSFGVSRDGRYLYFVKELADSTLWRLSLQSGEVSKVLDGLLPYCTSCWAEGENGIYYLGTDDSALVGQALFFHGFHGVPDRLIVEYPEPLFPLGSGPFSLSPDGRYLLCVRVDSSRADVMRAEPYR
jgi:Tol biopolymer transport system component/DNA-binding winged helix-turn-helix (wHTH) protein